MTVRSHDRSPQAFRSRRRRFVAGLATLCVAGPASAGRGGDDDRAAVGRIVDDAVRPLMRRAAIPGLAVGVAIDGRRHLFHLGVASRGTGLPVGPSTLFEIGSVSKTFTATLASYAAVTGALALPDPVSRHLPALRGSAFDGVRLLDLATHMTGGLPQQVPDDIAGEDGLLRYLRQWRPSEAPGTVRRYGNPGIGLLGRAAAASLQVGFGEAMHGRLFPALGLKDTFVEVPPSRLVDYAEGHTADDVPIRMAPGLFDAEAYGVRTTAGDLLRLIEANLRSLPLDERWQQAVTATHTGYARVGAMTQDLVWEQYDEPATLDDLLAGKTAAVTQAPQRTKRLSPPSPPRDDVVIDKTGATNGFSTYAVFAPARRIGIVLLMNKQVGSDLRVPVAFEILTRLHGAGPTR